MIRCHNVWLQSCWMVAMTSVRAPSWHNDICACALTRFVPYPLHKFRLTSSFSYLWQWHLSVLTPYHLLSADYVRVQLVHLFTFLLFLHDMEKFFRTIFHCLHVVSCPVSLCLHTILNYFSSCLHVGIYLLLVLPNLNHISNKDYPWSVILEAAEF